MTETRITHVRRIFGTDDDPVGTPQPIWLDVERLERLFITQGQGQTFRRLEYRFKWEDPGTDHVGNVRRDMATVRVENPRRRSQYVNVPICSMIEVIEHPGAQRFFYHPRNEEGSTTRELDVRRVVHRDTDWSVNSDEPYSYRDGSERGENYVDFELIDVFDLRRDQGNKFQRTRMHYRNEDYKERHGRSPSPTTPARLDPFQRIVNVLWDNPDDEDPLQPFTTYWWVPLGVPFAVGGGDHSSTCSPPEEPMAPGVDTTLFIRTLEVNYDETQNPGGVLPWNHVTQSPGAGDARLGTMSGWPTGLIHVELGDFSAVSGRSERGAVTGSSMDINLLAQFASGVKCKSTPSLVSAIAGTPGEFSQVGSMTLSFAGTSFVDLRGRTYTFETVLDGVPDSSAAAIYKLVEEPDPGP